MALAICSTDICSIEYSALGKNGTFLVDVEYPKPCVQITLTSGANDTVHVQDDANIGYMTTDILLVCGIELQP